MKRAAPYAMTLMCAVAVAALSGRALCAVPGAPVDLPVAAGPMMADTSSTDWGLGGFSIFQIRASAGGLTPLMRSEVFDARLVEILSRVQVPPLNRADIRVINRGATRTITVRNYILADVTSADAVAANTSIDDLANQWAAGIRKVLPRVSPMAGQ